MPKGVEVEVGVVLRLEPRIDVDSTRDGNFTDGAKSVPLRDRGPGRGGDDRVLERLEGGVVLVGDAPFARSGEDAVAFSLASVIVVAW